MAHCECPDCKDRDCPNSKDQREWREVDYGSMIGKLAAARASRDLQVERVMELEIDIETWRGRHAEMEKRCAALREAGRLAAEESMSAHAQLRKLQSMMPNATHERLAKGDGE